MLSALGVLASGVALHGMALAIDVNAATPEQLREIRGIGPKMAQVIIEERARGGRYESLDDLSDRVKGIGPKKAAAMQASGLTVGAGMVTRQGADDSVQTGRATGWERGGAYVENWGGAGEVKKK